MRKFLTVLVAVAAIGAAAVATSSTADARWGAVAGVGAAVGAGALDRLLLVLCWVVHWLLGLLRHTITVIMAMALTTRMRMERTDLSGRMATAVSRRGTAITGFAPVTDRGLIARGSVVRRTQDKTAHQTKGSGLVFTGLPHPTSA